MKTDYEYYCNAETVTGLVIRFNKASGDVAVVTGCCFDQPYLNGTALVCNNCTKMYRSKGLDIAVGMWTTEFNTQSGAINTTSVQQWASAWTGIDTSKLEVTIR